MELLSPVQYVDDATKLIHEAKERVILLSMVLADHDATHELVDAILLAARRGVKVSVAADVFTYGEINGGFLPLRYYSKPSRHVTNLGKLLRNAGVHFTWLSRTKMTIFSGRTHSKWCVVDDVVYSFGGVNTYQEGIENADYMFKTESKKLADRMEQEYSRLILADKSGRLYRSRQFDYNGDHVLIDGGILGNSIIYRRACDLAASAKSIIFVSQYPPTGKLTKLFRSKEYKLYFNRPSQAAWLNRLVINWGIWRSKLTTSYRRKRYLHAKFMIFTMPDGNKVALTGSHNFNYGGVLLGAREIALESRDPHVIEQLETFLKNEVR
jgi:cardiolipin synthase A/B